MPIDYEAKTEVFDSSLLKGRRVLIVDDLEVNRLLFTEQLKAWDLEADIAMDGVEALTKLKSAQNDGAPFDLILLDFLMPGMNGQDFARLISQTPSIKSPQIIMLSSCDQSVSTAELGEIGIDSYLVKPVRERRLFDTIVKVVSNPIDRVEEEKPCVAEQKSRVPTKQEILVAEDFPLNQEVVKLMLADSQFRPVFANNGQEVLDLYTQNIGRYPLILMDVSMPVMDGFRATQAIRAFEKKRGLNAIPIIALTGHALKNDRQDCLAAGMDDFLTKPVKQGQLMEKIENYSGRAIDIRLTA